ncbi:MAG TPA: SdpI family protein [Gemmatimonadaceae bacterium]|nr:SdpI family protein [Gemmatimonadaceae bacterium]
MRKWATAVPVATAFAFSAAVFFRLPEWSVPKFSAVLPLTATDSDAMPRLFLALFIPVTALLSWILINWLATVSKGRKPLPDWWINEKTGSAALKRFEPTFNTVMFSMMCLFLLIHVAVLGSVLGWPVWSFKVIIAIIGLGLIAAGNVMPRTKPNWMVGLRTKRTLSDPAVWARTHRVFGAMMIVAGSLVILSAFVAPRYSFVIAVGALVIGAFLAYIIGTRGARPSSTAIA